jgi:hypothetical protein
MFRTQSQFWKGKKKVNESQNGEKTELKVIFMARVAERWLWKLNIA